MSSVIANKSMSLDGFIEDRDATPAKNGFPAPSRTGRWSTLIVERPTGIAATGLHRMLVAGQAR